jgi:hypothetical protein
MLSAKWNTLPSGPASAGPRGAADLADKIVVNLMACFELSSAGNIRWRLADGLR